MFRKRKLPVAEAGLRTKLGDDNESIDEKEEDTSMVGSSVEKGGTNHSDKDGGAVVKRTKATSGLLIKEEGGGADSDKKSQKATEMYDGAALEEELEAMKQRNSAVVTIEDEKPGSSRKPASKFGPSSAPAYVRATTIVDYKPDLCKDYNETGYCGYGDTCIYLHDRTTYVAGNVLDQRWEELVKKAKSGGEKSTTNAASDPATNTCGICKKILANPAVRTRCGHSFCQSCAFTRFDKDPTCAVCGLATMGIFNDLKLPTQDRR